MPEIMCKGCTVNGIYVNQFLRKTMLDEPLRQPDGYLRDLLSVGQTVVEEVAGFSRCDLRDSGKPSKRRAVEHAIAVALRWGPKAGGSS